MTFTYDDDLTTNIDKVRFYVGDTQDDSGPRPDGRNFSDNEITFALTENGGGVTATVAGLFEVLESEWRAYAISEGSKVGDFDAKEVADGYGKQAEKWKKKALGTLAYANKAGSVQPARIDGYN